MIIINIGGEGEFPGAINLNSWIALRRPLPEVLKRGLMIRGDFTQMPIRSGCVDAIVGNHVPLLGEVADRTMRESFRVLRGGGAIRVHASVGGGSTLLEPMRNAGLAEVTLLGFHAAGRKP